ncbi:MAG: acylphosphatase [Gammaproteobacteria bacterium RBG_16_57_12]|nr:MAG: acylphosphatase [Gammaproteobacteria bacterium RBG_16_57_12]
MTDCVRCFVSGKVQGVFYRASTQRQARQLGLTGYARNLADGRVEVVACGGRQQLEHLQAWLWQGPQHAEVADVRCEKIEVLRSADFITR